MYILLVLEFILSFLLVDTVSEDTYTIGIFPQILSQNGRSHFEPDRWNSHNGLDEQIFIEGNKNIGSRTGRWLNPDFAGDIYQNATENPNRRGYPDPRFFNRIDVQKILCGTYQDDLDGYGNNRKIVIEIKSIKWPAWMNTSLHGGMFPNNLDAGAEMALYLIEAVYNYTKGNSPIFFEVVNEPDTMWKTVTWDTIIEYHKIVAQKLHEKFPLLKVGGPTKDGSIEASDQNNFQLWNPVRDFMNMSVFNMDFLSFHPYNAFYSQGDHHYFTGINEARLVAVIDMVESYASLLQGKSVQLILSEYGLGGRTTDAQTPASFEQWAYIFMHNCHMFTYLNHRGVIEQAVAFLLSHDTYGFGNGSLFHQNGSEANAAKAYRFWKTFDIRHQFLRVESQYDGKVRMVSPLAVIDTASKKVRILLHNYNQTPISVMLDFAQNWLRPTTAQSTCIYLDGNKAPILSADQTITVTGNVVNLLPESTCFFEFSVVDDLGNIGLTEEVTYYSKNMVIRIQGNSVNNNITLPDVDNLAFAMLRFGVSTVDKTANVIPTTLSINGYAINYSFSLYDPDRQTSVTQWEVLNYQVPVDTMKTGNNSITMTFSAAKSPMYVSAVALVVGSVL